MINWRKVLKQPAAYWMMPGFFAAAIFIAGNVFASDSNSVFIAQVRPAASLHDALSGYQPRALSRVFYFSSDPQLSRVYRFELPGDTAVLADLRASAAFEYVEREGKFRAADIATNDPEFTSDENDLERQWWLTKTGVLEAWESSMGAKTVTVAVVDTGINGKHEELSDGRVGSGYLSYCQVSGSASDQCLVHITASIAAGENTDDNGHGTIVAGIIGAMANNGKGIAGINWNIRLLPVKVLDSSGSGVSTDVAAGIVWATDSGADIINLSLGGTGIEGSAVLNQAIIYAYNKSALLVAAAGNDSALTGSDLDIEPVYPVCNDGNANMVLGVAAVDATDRKALFSNFGRGCIDIAAPGTAYFNSRSDQKGLVSTYFDPGQPTKNALYVFASGTSIAAPVVSGIAALVAARRPDLSAKALAARLTSSADSIDVANTTSCLGRSCTGRLGAGRVNAARALNTATFISDSLISDSSGGVYLIENGLRRRVSDFVLKQRSLNREEAKTVSLSEAELLPLGQPLPPQDGTLLKADGMPTVFYVERGILRPVSLLAFRSFGFAFGQVAVLPEAEVLQYRLGQDLAPQNGALLKLVNQPAVYLLHEGRRRLLSIFTFRNRGLNFVDVVEFSNLEFEKYPVDLEVPLAPPRDGSLLKTEFHPAVYVVEDGRLRTLSRRAFVERGYQSAQINLLSESEISAYTLGSDIP